MTDLVTYESSGGVAVVTITRADKMNALTDEVVDGLRDAWRRYDAGTDRCAVLTGAGSRAFCVGADLTNPPQEMWEAVPGVGATLAKPVIAAVSGHVVGGGYILVQHCDLAVATRSAAFAYPEAKVGLTGGMVASAVARIPHKAAMELMLLGGPIDGQRAYELGIVNRVVDDGQHLDTALTWAAQIAASAPLVVSTMKRMADATVPRSPSEMHAHTRRDLLAVNRSDDRDEGVNAFLEKRPPEFTGR